MPPTTPRKWNGIADRANFKPVCPQVLPGSLDNETHSLKYMTRGRWQYMKKLVPHLRQQSEDCLYLNIYAPTERSESGKLITYHGNLVIAPVSFLEAGRLLSVYVLLHDDSYEWSSGNVYDGTVLSSYNNVIVVTLNFRIGVLGFLRPGLERDGSMGNLGLLDQIAALVWLRENVGYFGGDKDRVHLIGHGTGANMATLLMISPVVQDGENFTVHSARDGTMKISLF